VLLGGPSPEREVSLRSGEQVVAALDRSRFDVLPVEISREGQWLPRPDLLQLAASPSPPPDGTGAPAPASTGTALIHAARGIDEVMGAGTVDVAFIAMHGPYGEDGTVQGLLELLGIPYTGSGVLASALAMDKLRSRQVLQASGIPVPAYVVVDGGAWPDEQAATGRRIARDLGYPCVVKPNAVGSSLGITVVRDEAALPAAVEEALAYGETVLVEEYLRGAELTCAVLEDRVTGEPRTLPVIEIVPEREFFTYEAKYVPGASQEIVPARISAAMEARAEQVALRVHRALGCEGYSRVDMFLSAGNIVALEANTIPGMTPGSLIPLAAQAAGITFPELLRTIIESGLRRARARTRHARRT